MVRQLVAVTFAVLGFVVAAEACSTPTQDLAPDSPAARATSARRTAAADVQRIIANIPSPTPSPAATATPSPTCPNAIWWTEARGHIGELRTVQGIVVASRPAPGGSALLEIGQPYPDSTGITALVPASTGPAVSGKAVCISSRIALSEGRPTLQVRDPGAIVVID